MTTNPDYRGANEIIPPNNFRDLLGWADPNKTEDENIDHEKRLADKLEADLPAAFNGPMHQAVNPEMLKKWNDFQKSKGRFEGSCDWTILDEFVHGKPLLYLPQIIGSCVMSNTFPIIPIRQMYQIVLQGRLEEYFGREEFGPNSYAIFAPMGYGLARKRANMRSGDGLYCEPMLESLMKDGSLKCSNPELGELLRQRGFTNQNDMPEPQGNDGAKLYREFGNWKHLDSFMGSLGNRVTKGSYIKSGDDLVAKLEKGACSFVCSTEAIHKVGEHPDGFAIHAMNPRDSWAHNMSFRGKLVASDGDVFIRQSNESWGAKHIYNRRLSEVDKRIRSGRLTIAAIEEVEGDPTPTPTVSNTFSGY